MKKWIKANIVMMIIAICTVMLTSFSSCAQIKRPKNVVFSRDSVLIETVIQEHLNPTMESPKQVLSVKQNCINTYIEDSIFRNMDNYVLQSISTVLFNRQPEITIKDIITEYTLNKDVYDNLKPRPQLKEKTSPDTINNNSK